MKRFVLAIAVALFSLSLMACSGQSQSQSSAASSSSGASSSAESSASESQGAASDSAASDSQSSSASAQSAASDSAQSAAAAKTSDAYLGKWVSGRATLEIVPAGDDYKCTVVWGSSASESSEWVYEPSVYDGANLVCEGLGVKTNYVYNEGGSVKSSEEEFSDGSGSFALGDDGKLTWIDFKVYPSQEGLVFERAQ